MVLVSRSVLLAAVPLSTAGSPLLSSLMTCVLVPAATVLTALEFLPSARLMSSLLPLRARMAHKLETQGARHRRGFDQFDRDRIAEPMRFRVTDEGPASLVEAIILVADQARRNEAIGAGVVELNE